MKYEEERHAKDLYRALSQALAEAEVSVEGDGVHWKCTATRGDLACSVCCFDTGAAEYLASFRRGERTEAWGRTRSKEDIVAAVGRWLSGEGAEELRTRFPFVDRLKRALAALAAEAVQSQPELGRSATHEVRERMCDLSELLFTAGDRSCRAYFYSDNEFPDAYFHWDGCEMFRFRADDPSRLGAVLKSWLCDRAMPSQMAARFPWLRLAPVARYYEEGRPVEGEFIVSWDSIERFYAEGGWRFTPEVLAMIAAIRRAGYDKTLRAGQSLWSLVVSRSRRHGLRDGQPHIVFWFHDVGMDVYINIGSTEKHSLPGIEFTGQVEAFLRRLVVHATD